MPPPPLDSQIPTSAGIVSLTDTTPVAAAASAVSPLQSLFVPPTPAPTAPMLTNLFQAPPQPPEAPQETTALLSNQHGLHSDFYIGSSKDDYNNSNNDHETYEAPLAKEQRARGEESSKSKMKRKQQNNQETVRWTSKLAGTIKEMTKATFQAPTFAGAFMFLLYHVVFCLANGSAMIRPHSMDKPILGSMAKLSTVGIIMSGPFYILRLGANVPAVYPSIDLFLAPFLARAAVTIDESLAETYAGEEYPEEAFFASFCVLTGIGMFLSGVLLQLGATFKLANLGTFLPYSVLCGFFSAVGVLLWALAFSVDTSGKSWKQVFFSGDSHLIMESLLHHMPSLLMGILMNQLGPKNPFFVLLLILVTLGLFYLTMLLTGTSLEHAQQEHWFWSREELVVDKSNNSFEIIPLCNVFALLSNNTDWKAVQDGLGHMVALAFLYLLRSSIHASAMKKNIGNLVRRVPIPNPELREENPQGADSDGDDDDDDTTLLSFATHPLSNTYRIGNAAASSTGVLESVRQTVKQVQWSLLDDAKEKNHSVASLTEIKSTPFDEAEEPDRRMYTEIRAKPTNQTLEEIFIEYGYALYVVSLFGGFGCCPTVATSNTMYAIGAEGRAPQFGSILLLMIFYFTEFDIVQYIPKAAFSSLLVLGGKAVLFSSPF